MEEKQVFLIQSSHKPAKHNTVSFTDRTYADEVMRHGYYRNEDWDIKKRDQDFGKITIGDYILHYTTGDVKESRSQIKLIYEVTAIERVPEKEVDEALRAGRISKDFAERLKKGHHILRLKPHKKLKQGLNLHSIQQWVSDGKLSKNMNNCGKLGFNICQVSYDDYKTMVDWASKPPSSSPQA